MIKRIQSLIADLETNTSLQYLLLAGITLLAAVLRFYKLGEWSYWIEEHHSYRHTMGVLPSLESLLSIRRPFYLFSKITLDYLGWNEFNSRIIPAVIGIITIPFIFWVAKKLFKTWIAVLAAILLAISPWHLYWSQNFRFYTLFLLLYNVSLFAFFWGLERNQGRYFLLSIIFIVAAGLIQGAVAAFVVPILASYVLLLRFSPFEKPPGLRDKYLIYSLISLLLAYTAFESYRILIKGTNSLASEVYYLFINRSTASFVGYANPYIMLTSVIYYVGVPLACLAVIGTIFLLKEKSRIGLFLALGAFGHLVIFMVLTLFASTANRYVFMSLPFWIILGAVGLKKIFVRATDFKVKIIPAVVLVGVLLLLMKDPVVEDVVYYIDKELFFGLAVLTGGLICFLAFIPFVWSFKSRVQDRLSLGLAAGILLIVLLHPLLTDVMYFTFQHGHRNDWKSLATTVKQSKTVDESLFTFMPALANFYIGDQADHVGPAKLQAAMNRDKNFWLIESDGFWNQTPAGFEKWMETNCNTVGVWDEFTAGQTWKMRAHLCTPSHSKQTQVSK